MTRPRRRKAAAKKKPPPRCPKCGAKASIRSGMVQGEQRWKCKSCAYQYTRVAPRGRPLWQKSLVVFLYSYGVSMHAIGRIFHIQPSTVLKWVRLYAQDFRPSPEKGDIALMGMDDIKRHLKTSGDASGILCIAIDNPAFKKSLGITIRQR